MIIFIPIVLWIILAYLLAGFVFALWFAFKWVNDFDEQSKGASFSFRILIIPASTFFWIYLLMKMRKKRLHD